MVGGSCGPERGDDECIWRNESNHLEDQDIDKGITLKLALIEIEWDAVN